MSSVAVGEAYGLREEVLCQPLFLDFKGVEALA